VTVLSDAAITIEPDTADAAAAALHDAAARRHAVVICGAGTKLSWGRPPRHVDVIVRTARLDRVLAHQHGDLTVVVEGGATLAAVNAALAPFGQWLPLDPPHADRATIGGVLATNDSGPLRHRYGAPRDLVIGVQLALPDGSLPRAGGQVVKNVAGYDLSKLIAGSFGSLALVVNATFKLAPVPPVSRTLVMSPASGSGSIVAAIMRSQIDPIAFEVHARMPASQEHTSQILVRFGTVAAAVDAQIESVRRLPEVGRVSTDVVDGDAERAAWREHDARMWAGDAAVVRANWRPAAIDEVIALLGRCAGRAPIEIELAGRAALGAGLIRIHGAIGDQASTVLTLRESPLLTHVVLVRGSDALKSRVDVWGDLGDNARLFAALKHAFDPDGILNAGRGPL
jgi:glycolate oxidase FAD binding subunit